MASTAHQLVSVIKTIIAATTSLTQHVNDLLVALEDQLPDDEPTQLTASVAEDTTDATRMTAQLAWNNTDYGHVMIDWGVTDATDDDEPAVGTASYQYATAGTYEITVTDQNDATRTAQVDVTVPFTVTGI